jgi:uncharacterized caspase-like protein
LLAVAAAVFAASRPAHAERLALVIGNAGYTQFALKNPVNDARAMEERLKALGFRTTLVENLKRSQIGRTVSAFVSTIKPGDELVFFYAGHGMQVRGVNYFPAVNAQIDTPEDAALNSMNLNDLMERFDAAKAAVKPLLLDACRNDPFSRSFRGAERGLARMVDAPSGTLIQYATRPGSVAADGDGRNGLYTANLAKALRRQGAGRADPQARGDSGQGGVQR